VTRAVENTGTAPLNIVDVEIKWAQPAAPPLRKL
jgi:hypothetical protein